MLNWAVSTYLDIWAVELEISFTLSGRKHKHCLHFRDMDDSQAKHKNPTQPPYQSAGYRLKKEGGSLEERSGTVD